MRSHDSTELLFWKYDMYSVLENQKRSVTTHVDQLAEARILDASDDVLTAELVDRLRIDVPTLDEAAITVSPPHEVQIEVSRDYQFAYGPQSVKGVEVTFRVPYVGNTEFFRVRPTRYTLNPPRAILRTGELGFPFCSRELNAEQVRREFDGQLKSVKEFLTWQEGDVKPFNDNLRNEIFQAVGRRRERLQRAQAAVSSFGFPVRG